MESFVGKKAVVTGGGSGMGRELVIQLARQGCSVATCDVDSGSIEETLAEAQRSAPDGALITTHLCDVSEEAQVLSFRDEVVARHGQALNLVFNNAGIGGGGGFLTGSREEWEQTFAVDWWGVYYCTRAFLPLLVASTDGYLVNTSSVNGFWASLGPGTPHTAYSTAKFAVKGFSESLIEDLRVNAPHVKVAVVMPGHIGTNIPANSRRYLGNPAPDDMTEADLAPVRAQLGRLGFPVEDAPADELRQMIKMMGERFRDSAPLTAAAAATIILDSVRAGKWRILVGQDAQQLDVSVRANPEGAYDHTGIGLAGGLRLGTEGRAS
jgi:NAD(P)-dependent dehydrogenase (short-subunit alcohol dehydrogenase family)